MIKSFLLEETGLELSEYAIAAALIISFTLFAFVSVGNAVAAKINDLVDLING